MLFNSFQFLLFLPIVILIFYILPSNIKRLWLLLASYYFYMCWNAKYGLLILFATVLSYIISRIVARITKRKQLILALGILLCLSLLFYFKYFNYALKILVKGFEIFHISLSIPSYDIILPVGISFYSFQVIGYMIDVYRGNINVEKNFIKYSLYVSFFPQLVAGPIERSKNILPQLDFKIKKDFYARVDDIRKGFLLIIWGYFLKLVLADRIAMYVDFVYADVVTYNGFYLVLANILFAFQIYCDFYGYSIIAKGAAKMIGIELMENFDAPYLETTVAGFWQKWHISLTSWFRDYLYIPLGGNKKGTMRKYLNIMIVFLVSGMWHGASVSYVIWGGINGINQIIGYIFLPFRRHMRKMLGIHETTLGFKVISILKTFVLVDFAWIFFRSGSLGVAKMVLENMITTYNPWILLDGSIFRCGLDRPGFFVLLIGLMILTFADICRKNGIVIHDIILRQDAIFRWMIYVVLVVSILLFGVYGTGYDKGTFLYFQF